MLYFKGIGELQLTSNYNTPQFPYFKVLSFRVIQLFMNKYSVAHKITGTLLTKTHFGNRSLCCKTITLVIMSELNCRLGL